MRPLLLLLLGVWWGSGAQAGEAYLREGDVVSFVGGQDTVVAAELGEAELELTLRNPTLHLRFRSLAREGDTVFEQHRDLNYPALEEQLATTGTTVLVAEFGRMESLAGASDEQFSKAYGALLDRLSGKGARRGVLIVSDYEKEVQALANQRGWGVINALSPAGGLPIRTDGVHLSPRGQALLPLWLARGTADSGVASKAKRDRLRALISAKNRLWYHYYRPQNWAFLAGDRTNQPSSRDHLDPTRRWFPAEMQKFLPLIEAKEKEIAAVVAEP